jgi:lipid-A-disaccharide synthase
LDRHQSLDLFISTGEPSGDLHGARLIKALLEKRPNLKIGAVSGPRIRKLQVESLFRMEDLSIMGFIDVLLGLPKIIRQFFKIQRKILQLNPKVVVFVDYPGFHLRLEKSLKKKGFSGKLVHFVCPTVWAWGKKRISTMEKTLDLLLTIFPFEAKHFAHTGLKVKYIGHPLADSIPLPKLNNEPKEKILGIFPGSRDKEIERNLPLQLEAAIRLQKIDPSLKIVISCIKPLKVPLPLDLLLIPPEKTYDLMKSCHLAIATSGTVNLELALHNVPTVVTYAINNFDCFLAQKIFRINLPYYCIVNIILEKEVFPELFGPNLTFETLFSHTLRLWTDEKMRKKCFEECQKIRAALKKEEGLEQGALEIVSLIDF